MKVGVTDLDRSALTKAVLESLSQDASLAIQLLPEDQALEQWCAAASCAPPSCFQPNFEAVGDRRAGGQRPDAGGQAALRSIAIHGSADGRGIVVTQHVMQRLSRPNFIGNAKPIPFNARQCRGHDRASIQLLRPLLRRHEHSIHSVHGHRRRHCAAADAPRRHVAPLARRAFVPCRAARQPGDGHHADRDHDSGGRLPGGARGCSMCASPAACLDLRWSRALLRCWPPPPAS